LERKIIDFLEEEEWGILNGCTRGDEEGEYTGTKGNTIIDYTIGDEEVKERVERVKIGEIIKSDNLSVEV